MNTKFTGAFDKDVNKISDAKLLVKIELTIEFVEDARSLRAIPGLKKLKGYRIHYRIRIGDYRIGITIIGDTVTFERCLIRNEFYWHYPPKN